MPALSPLLRWLSTGATVLGSFSLLTQSTALAQIVPDNTLGNEPSRVRSGVTLRGQVADQIEGGAVRGANLFHSFSDFDVNQGQRVYFANPTGIDNIISRVTGRNVSNIDGLLGVDGLANLFLLNPNGIIFGPNAQLDVSGSFTASTGDRFTFPDGSEFSATNPQAPPLLTVSVPIGLQYGAAPEAIASEANLSAGQDLTLFGGNLNLQGQLTAGETLSLNAQERIQVQSGSTLFSGRDTVVQSPIRLLGDANYTVGGYFIIQELDGTPVESLDPRNNTSIIRTNGDVTLTGEYSGPPLFILAGGKVQLSGVSITSFGITRDISDGTGGNQTITVNPQQALSVSSGVDWAAEGGLTSANEPASLGGASVTYGTATGGNLDLQGQLATNGENIALTARDNIALTVDGTLNLQGQLRAEGTLTLEAQGAIASQANLSAGQDLTLNGRNLNLLQGQLNATGNLTLQAQNTLQIQDSETQPFQATAGNQLLLQGDQAVDISLNNYGSSLNAGGDLVLRSTSGNINISGGTLNSSSTNTPAGQISINGQNVTLSNTEINSRSSSSTGGQITIAASGNVRISDRSINSTSQASSGGPVSISGQNVTLERVGIDTASFGGSGGSGGVSITANGGTARLLGGDSRPTIYADSFNSDSGSSGGDIRIEAATIDISDYELNAAVNSSGSGSDIILSATGNIRLDNSTFTTEVQAEASGSGGGIQINDVGSLSLNNSILSASTAGAGAAGQIRIAARNDVTLTNGSQIRSNVETGASGRGGDIQINAPSLSLTSTPSEPSSPPQPSQISASTAGSGNAGTITLGSANDPIEQITISGNGSGIFVTTNDYLDPTVSTFGEQDDVGQLLNNARLITDVSQIIGSLENPDDVDLYRIELNGQPFSATTQGTVVDTRLFLFDQQGLGVYANEDISDSDFSSRLPEDNALTPTASGTYYLAVSSYGRYPVSPNGSIFGLESAAFTDVVGRTEPGGGSRLNDWQGNGLDSGNYTIQLTGVNSQTPRPLPGGVGGVINVHANSVNVLGGGSFSAETRGSGPAGNLSMTANTVTLQGSRITAAATGNSPTSRAGNVTINAQTIDLSDNSGIVTINSSSAVPVAERSRFGNIQLDNVNNLTVANSLIVSRTESGVAGSVQINGGTDSSVTLSGVTGDLNGDGIINILEGEGVGGIVTTAIAGGRAGDVLVNTNRLSISSDAQITASNRTTAGNGSGSAGNVTVSANTITLNNGDIDVETEAGAGGNVIITDLNTLSATNGSSISTSTGTGIAGSIRINEEQPAASTIQFTDSALRANAASGQGNAGDVTVNTQGLTVERSRILAQTVSGTGGDITLTGLRDLSATNSQISASTDSGIAGNVTINATDSVVLTGNGPLTNSGDPSDRPGISVQARNGGNAGDIAITTPTLTVQNGARVSASTAGNNGGDLGGSITVTADTVSLFGQPNESDSQRTGLFSETNGAANAGDLTLQPLPGTGDLQINFSNGAQLSALTRGSGEGGNVSIIAPQSVAIAGNGTVSVDTRNTGQGGRIDINAPTLTIRDGARVSTSTSGTGAGGKIRVTADTVNLSGATTALSSNTSNTGAAGTLNLIPATGRSLTVNFEDGAQLSARTTGQGEGGNVFLGDDPRIAPAPLEAISLRGRGSLQVSAEGGGNAGLLGINTNLFNLGTGVRLVANSIRSRAGAVAFRSGDVFVIDSRIEASTSLNSAGGIIVQANRRVQLRGTFQNDNGTVLPAGLFVEGGASGEAGFLTITTPRLIIENGAQASARARAGRGGGVSVNAHSIEINSRGETRTRTGILASSTSGTGGNILLFGVNQLNLQDGVISAETQTGVAGNVRVNAAGGTVQLRGSRTRLTASATGEGGRAGNVEIIARRVNVENGARLTAQATGRQGRAGNVTVTARGGSLTVSGGAELTVRNRDGVAGNLRINAGTVILNRGNLIAIAGLGDNGNIIVTQSGLLFRPQNNSRISAQAINSASGGTVRLNVPNGFVLTNYLENNDIIASALGEGDGGSVRITALGIFGLEQRSEETSYSDIVVTSRFGTDGTVVLDTLGVDPTRGLAAVPELVDPSDQVDQGCGADGAIAQTQNQQTQNQFVVSGRGGLPAQPTGSLTPDAITGDWVSLEGTATEQATVPSSRAELQEMTEIVEAQGWSVSEKGDVILTAPPTATAPSDQFSTTTCQSSL
ncbi:MAG: filamentous hemagglutinin N-terminal domain-containing protein [Oculatellaceae cyanobacterium bins.114]|nr:filamentous hemagglutinin N-terminal domain-containing protein [Oculatellaceae cyanobacterium bins.114]